MGKISGNKGEWSEIYAFLRILSNERIYGADGDLNKREDIYYDVNRIIRDEGNGVLEYSISENGLCVEVRSGDRVIICIVKDRVIEESDFLLERIINSKGPAFSIDRTEDFMIELGCSKIKAPSKDKSDITLEIHDYRTGMDPVLKFSIKSALGHPSTLLNAGRTTNVVFSLGSDIPEELINYVNGNIDIETGKIDSRPTLATRYSVLLSAGIDPKFVETEVPTFEDNLRFIDHILPDVISEMLKLHYMEGVNRIDEQVKILTERNPLGIRSAESMPYYEQKVKKLLVACALGMQPGTPWTGFEDASGGYIVVKQDGEVLCYHLYNRNDFEDYLIRHTKLETASTTRHDFSKIYRDANGSYLMKLNLQIRFF